MDPGKRSQETESSNEEGSSPKRQKVDNSAENASTQSSGPQTTQTETISTSNNSGVKVEDVEGPDTEHCVVCMEEGAGDNPLLDHQCTRCVQGAWKICLVCNETLLSRQCPMCRADYAPLVLHVVPGMPFKRLADPTLSADEKTALLYKFGIVRQMVSRSNIAGWNPITRKMHFSLPARLLEGHGQDNENNYIITAVELPQNPAHSDIFNFTNSTWDLIENEVEHGALQPGDSVDLKAAVQWILSVTKEDGHKLFTVLSPSDWDYMLNPERSSDTSEALKAIKDTILQNVESIIPNLQQT